MADVIQATPPGDPSYIKDKDRYFMEIAKTVALASTHPLAPGGCVLVRDRELIGNGRSLLAACKTEVDCISYAIATTCKRGAPAVGAVIYSTRYPFPHAVFQAHLMGIKRFVVLAHEWEPFYRDDFRRAARLAREVSVAIEPFYETPDPRLEGGNPHALDDFDPQSAEESDYEHADL